MKVLIVDGDKISGKHTESIVKQFNVEAIIAGNFQSITETKNWLQHNVKPDLIISETTFEDGLIFDLADEISFSCPLILTSNQKNYALDAFKLNTIDYIIKPLSLVTLQQALDKFFVLKSIFSNPQNDTDFKERFGVALGNKMLQLSIHEISFFLAEDKTVYLQAKNGSRYVIDYTLDSLEKQISSTSFFRINRQVIAKIDAIESIKKFDTRRLKLALAHGKGVTEFIVSREKVKDFKRWIGV